MRPIGDDDDTADLIALLLVPGMVCGLVVLMYACMIVLLGRIG